MTARAALLVIACLATGACGGGAGAGAQRAAPAGVPASRPVSQSDLEIADLAYTDRQRVPAGFYTEPARYDAGYLTIHHLRSSDLDPAAAAIHELCSDDPAQALAWSEQVALAAPVYGDLVETNGDFRYHEFVRALRASPARHVLERVYRCSWLDRDAVDLATPTAAAGTFGLAAFTPADLGLLGEYLYTFTVDNNAGRVVLASRVAREATGATHTIIIARLAPGASGSCDRIEVSAIDLHADAPGGLLRRTETALWRFNAMHVAGQTSLCP